MNSANLLSMKMSGEEFTWGRKFWLRKFRYESSVVKCAGEKYTVNRLRFAIPPMLTSIAKKPKMMSEVKRPPKWSKGVSSTLDANPSFSNKKMVLFVSVMATN